ncbi:MAG TPA: nucleotidyltransferase family protein [Blastocatellia bacterium]|nr:nucleotidyltransferase family protein [Blastocatellia bacterium]
MTEFISGLVLGAGASTRFGEPKQLLPYRGTTLIEWVVSQALQAPALNEVVVVLGRAADEIRRRVDFKIARVVDNPVFGAGCASSYRAGIAAINTKSDAIMILLGDQPDVSPEIIGRVAEVFRRQQDQIVLASYRGRKGHPMIFARSMFDKLVDLHGDKAAWKLVDTNPDLVGTADLDVSFPQDINTREDFERLSGARQL